MNTFTLRHIETELFTPQEMKVLAKALPGSLEAPFAIHALFDCPDPDLINPPIDLKFQNVAFLAGPEQILSLDKVTTPQTLASLPVLKSILSMLITRVSDADEKHRAYDDDVNWAMTRAMFKNDYEQKDFSMGLMIFPFGIVTTATHYKNFFDFVRLTYDNLDQRNIDLTKPDISEDPIPLPKISLTDQHFDRFFSIILNEGLSNHQKIEAFNFLSTVLNTRLRSTSNPFYEHPLNPNSDTWNTCLMQIEPFTLRVE